MSSNWPDKPSALDQVVTDVESIGAQGILETFSTDDRIAQKETGEGEDR